MIILSGPISRYPPHQLLLSDEESRSLPPRSPTQDNQQRNLRITEPVNHMAHEALAQSDIRWIAHRAIRRRLGPFLGDQTRSEEDHSCLGLVTWIFCSGGFAWIVLFAFLLYNLPFIVWNKLNSCQERHSCRIQV